MWILLALKTKKVYFSNYITTQVQFRLTESSVMGELLVNLFHPLDVEPAALCVVDHGFGVVHSHHTVGSLLDRLWGVPGLVYVPVWVVL